MNAIPSVPELISFHFSRRGDGGRDWPRDRNERRVDGGERQPQRDRDDRHDNGLTEEEREKRLAEKMPKHKPPEGPVSIDLHKLFVNFNRSDRNVKYSMSLFFHFAESIGFEQVCLFGGRRRRGRVSELAAGVGELFKRVSECSAV